MVLSSLKASRATFFLKAAVRGVLGVLLIFVFTLNSLRLNGLSNQHAPAPAIFQNLLGIPEPFWQSV